MASPAVKSIKSGAVRRRPRATILNELIVNAVKQVDGKIEVKTDGSIEIVCLDSASAERFSSTIKGLIRVSNESSSEAALVGPGKSPTEADATNEPSRRLFVKHRKGCPNRTLGTRHFDGSCPIWMHEYIDKDGRQIWNRSLKTSYLPRAVARLAAFANGLPIEALEGMGRIYRLHVKGGCPLGTKRGFHTECSCPIWIYITRDGKHRQRATHTNVWEDAEERLTAVENGLPLEALAKLAKLFRHHGKGCAFRKLGRRHTTCLCPIYMEILKNGRLRRWTLDTTDWRIAKEKLKELVAAGISPSVSVGARLRAAREKAGLSRGDVELAFKRMGLQMTAAAVKKHENDERSPGEKLQQGYTSLFKKTWNELFGSPI